MSKFMGIIFSSTIVFSMVTSAVAGTPGINRRENRQQDRIAQGIASGELKPGEAVRLELQQAKIRRHEAAAKADGHVSFVERLRLHHELNKQNRKIFKNKHD